jgi:hypothetical protein
MKSRPIPIGSDCRIESPATRFLQNLHQTFFLLDEWIIYPQVEQARS